MSALLAICCAHFSVLSRHLFGFWRFRKLLLCTSEERSFVVSGPLVRGEEGGRSEEVRRGDILDLLLCYVERRCRGERER